MSFGTDSKTVNQKLLSSEEKYSLARTIEQDSSLLKQGIQVEKTKVVRTAPSDLDSNFWLDALTGGVVVEDESSHVEQQVQTGFSSVYIQYKTRELVVSVKSELLLWSESETHEALVHISAIKDELDKYFGYLSQDDNHRLFVSALTVIVSQWEELNQEQLASFAEHLDSYADGQISENDISNLNQFLFTTKINPFSIDD